MWCLERQRYLVVENDVSNVSQLNEEIIVFPFEKCLNKIVCSPVDLSILFREVCVLDVAFETSVECFRVRSDDDLLVNISHFDRVCVDFERKIIWLH